MLDQFERNIDYLRISITDRCNLRCVYCMPEEGVEWMPHEEILSYEEILRLCRVFAALGIRKIKLTGGEPLCRKGVADLVREIKGVEGIDCVTLTTNGMTLAKQLPALVEAGLDGVNISLDTLDRKGFEALTRRDGLPQVLEGLHAALAVPGLSVKLNCVPTARNQDQLVPLARLARDHAVAVRFIELMPIGLGAGLDFQSEEQVRALLEGEFGPMTPCEERLGNGPCHYVNLSGFTGRIGFISAMSHNFCAQCNRVRLTAQGFLKTCLQYERGADLRAILRGGGSDEKLMQAVSQAIGEKPSRHHFEQAADQQALERHGMSQIGG